ncbi:MAG TPA: hypothetical protein VJ828_19030, partial [Lacipirellulaceae bacterium]|nr:hypothetical protein [Lacipirellulaceae bacterium]
IILREAAPGGQVNVGEGLLQRLLDLLLNSNASVVGYAALPFQPFIDLIVAEKVSTAKIGLAAASFGIVTLLATVVIALYATIARRVADRERRNYRITNEHSSDAPSAQNELGEILQTGFAPSLRHVPWWGGAGALMWRQLIGARRCWGSLLTAMIAPAVLACAPCFVIANANIALLATAATLAFYTFLLLPTAVRFDFRRDLDRMAMFKSLPIAPAAAVIGQTIGPVLIATLFQTVVLAFAINARSLPPYYLFFTMLVMLPMNALVFNLENLIFLLYPYRIQQEGLEIFVRTMLTFTGKGLLFALGLGAMTIWGFAAADLTRGLSHWTGIGINAFAVFTAGMIAGPSVLAVLVFYALRHTYHNLDPIEDIPR